MKIVRSQNEEQSFNLAANTFTPKFEIKIDSSVQISKKAYATNALSCPIDTQTVLQAASMLREMMLCNSKTSVLTQANTTKQRVALLIDEE